jgi:hypothetical protein
MPAVSLTRRRVICTTTHSWRWTVRLPAAAWPPWRCGAQDEQAALPVRRRCAPQWRRRRRSTSPPLLLLTAIMLPPLPRPPQRMPLAPLQRHPKPQPQLCSGGGRNRGARAA